MPVANYDELLLGKVRVAPRLGYDCPESLINPALKPHNRVAVKWMVEGGRRACFMAFGLHKTVTQLEALRLTIFLNSLQTNVEGRGLIVLPLSVRNEFVKDATNLLGWSTPPEFIRRIEDADSTGIYMTNYETIREGKLDPHEFLVASLDEASCLRGMGGTKTFREFMRLFTPDGGPMANRRGLKEVLHRFVATATPSPNDYIELLAYAAFLGVMDVSQAKTRFFKRDSTQADNLTLLPHMEESFWFWVASWALFVQKPSDLGFSDEGYILPELDVRWHEVASDHSKAGAEKNGQLRLLADSAIGVQDAAREKRESLSTRIEKLMQLRKENPKAHRIIWHDLEAERHAIQKAIPKSVAIYGSQKLELREQHIADFSNGEIQELSTKPVITGSGCNLQRHCSWSIYLGIGFKFNDWIQSVHRLQRYGQKGTVRIDMIYTEAEREVKKALERKWEAHKHMVNKMSEIIKRYGLSQAEMVQTLARKTGIERIEIATEQYSLVNNDCVRECQNVPDDSVGLILTSIPFATQFEYSPHIADFGHNDGNREFFEQMDFLTPELYRTLQPGRVAAIHVKDRIVPAGLASFGRPTVYPFHLDCIQHYMKHGFGYMGMITVVTDVVRENAQTYRLGWTENGKDSSKMGVGMPEYILLFCKPPTDTSNGYADVPVKKQKPLQRRKDGTTHEFKKESKDPIVPGTGYSRARWQVDAHGYWRSNGNRLLTPEEWTTYEAKYVFRMFRQLSLNAVYDYEHHVNIGENLEAAGKLPPGFMLLQPQSWTDEVWTDITRMRTLNGTQWSKGKELHLCPMQFDIAERCITRFSNEGDTVLDPFSGLGTVPMWAVKLDRFGLGFELNPQYFIDSSHHVRGAAIGRNTPTLFDAEDYESSMDDIIDSEIAAEQAMPVELLEAA